MRLYPQFLAKRGRILIGVLIVIAVFVVLDAYARGQFGSKAVISSAHFELRGLAKQQAQAVLVQLESSYERIGRNLETRPASRIRVFVYANRWAYGRNTGNWGASGNVEGPEKIHVLWVGKETGQTAIHEFAHTVTLRLLIDHEPKPLDTVKFEKRFASLPVWLWEAVACYESNQAYNPMSFPYMRDGKYPSLSELNQRSKGAKIYDVGYSLVDFIESKWGHDRLIKLILTYGDVRKVLGVTDKEFSKLWSDFVHAKYQ